MSLHLLLLLNFALAGFLSGLIWLVQVVQYPGLGLVGRAEFARFHAAHARRIGYVVGPAMLAELGLAGWLAVVGWRPLGGPLMLGQLALVLLAWAATGLVAVPFHSRLTQQGYDFVVIDGLTRTNWLRTLAWTARWVLCGVLLA